jgi:hypothetical protein
MILPRINAELDEASQSLNGAYTERRSVDTPTILTRT